MGTYQKQSKRGKSASKTTIFRSLRRVIIMGHLKPGERLNIEELACRYDTSVTPVRDALQMLNQEGLVTIKPRSGYFITRMTLKELRDLLEFREILELSLIERSVKRITEEQIKTLSKVHAGYTGDDDESYDRYTDENHKFHTLLAEASGNQEMAGTLAHLLDRLARFMVLTRAGELQEATHGAIIKGLEARDLKAARTALLADLKQSQDAVMEQVFQNEAESWHL